MVLLDIVHLLVRGVSASDLAKSGTRAQTDKLAELLDGEKKQKQLAARRGATRHSRFNTTVTVKDGDKRYTLHRQSAVALEPTKVLDMAKKVKTKKARTDDDLAPPTELRTDAMASLRQFADQFLDQAANRAFAVVGQLTHADFFGSVIKDITMERAKVKQADTLRIFVVSSFFLDFFLHMRARDLTEGVDPKSEHGHDFDMIAELTEQTTIGFVARRIKDSLEEKPPLWTELHAAIDCFIQMLLTIDALSASPDEEHRETADVLQNKLYYQSEILDSVLEVVSKFKDQSKKYLESVIHLVYILMRLLEKYSKNKNGFMIVRKKARAGGRKKKGEAQKAAPDENDEAAMADEDWDREMDFKDHQFEFSKFEEVRTEPLVDLTHAATRSGASAANTARLPHGLPRLHARGADEARSRPAASHGRQGQVLGTLLQGA